MILILDGSLTAQHLSAPHAKASKLGQEFLLTVSMHSCIKWLLYALPNLGCPFHYCALAYSWPSFSKNLQVGVHAGNGRFIILDSLKPRYVVPDLSDCKLKPYVSKVGPEKPSSAAETSK